MMTPTTRGLVLVLVLFILASLVFGSYAQAGRGRAPHVQVQTHDWGVVVTTHAGTFAVDSGDITSSSTR
jgi:hypothetical protein